MGETTAISWTDHTFNPWWGCTKVSAECTNCYAETFDKRVGGKHWGANAPRRFFSEKHWLEPHKWDAAAAAEGVRRRVFCASMADVFEERAELDSVRECLWNLIANTPHLDWLLLTKRPEAAAVMLPWAIEGEAWPNVWLGTTCGVRDSLDRVARIRRIPAAVRFVSCEPLLEHISASDWDRVLDREIGYGDIHWLIVGNESGPRRRSAQLDWVRTAREAAKRNRVAFHFKQWVEPNGKKTHLPILDGVQHAAFPEAV